MRWNSSGAGTGLLGNQAILGALMRSSKYLNNIIEQDHRAIKARIGPMPGFKKLQRAKVTIAGIELLHRIRKLECRTRRMKK